MQKNGETINFDVKKIKVTVTVDDPFENNKYPVVRLNRISKYQLAQVRNVNLEVNAINSTISSPVLSKQAKRKSDIPSSYMTRSKKAKLTDEMSVPTTESNVFINSYSKKKTVSKPELKLNSDVGTKAKSTKQQQFETVTTTVAVPEFKVGEIVWAKLRGWPHWPAKLLAIESKRYEIYWFNDYRKSKVFRSQLFKFHDHFSTFSQKFGSSIGLETAAKEALLYSTSTNSKN